jgi:hypothetical protein
MNRRVLGHTVGIITLCLLGALFLPNSAGACEECHTPWFTPWNSWCRPVSGDEVGVTLCKDETTLINTTCQEYGNACQVITVIGGGGGDGTGGGSGGGSNPCQTSGFCPAECFSCGGGGGGGIPAG